jgi:hypothetical protein
MDRTRSRLQRLSECLGACQEKEHPPCLAIHRSRSDRYWNRFLGKSTLASLASKQGSLVNGLAVLEDVIVSNERCGHHGVGSFS